MACGEVLHLSARLLRTASTTAGPFLVRLLLFLFGNFARLLLLIRRATSLRTHRFLLSESQMGKVSNNGKDATGERFTQPPKLFDSLCSRSRNQLLPVVCGIADNICSIHHQ
jgi:hypothetical protein